MNRDEFEARYELIAQVTEGVFESHHALHHSGVVVMAHFVSGSEDLKAAVQAAAEGLSADDEDRHVIESHRIDDTLVVVTRFLKDFESLEGWLASRGYPLGRVDGEAADVGSADAGGGGGGGAGDASGGPGEFTRMFMAARGLGDDPGPGSAAPSDTPPSSAGEERDLHGAPAPPATGGPSGGASSTAPPPPAPPAPESPASGPGEFTQMFRAVPPKSEPQAPAPVDQGGGHAPDRQDPTAAGPGSGPPPAAPSGASSDAGSDGGAGEFTQMFRALGGDPPGSAPAGGGAATPKAPTPPATPGPTSPTPPDSSTSRPPESSDELRGADAPAASADRFAPPPKEETGEFTRFFRPAEGSGAPDRTDEPSLDWSDAPMAGRSREPDSPATPPTPSDDWAKALRTERPSTPRGSPSTPTPPVEETPKDHGEFTQIFGAETLPLGGASGGTPPRPETPSKAKGGPPPGSSSSSIGGFKTPKVPKARIPDAEALIRGGRMRRGKPPRFRPPRGRRLARMGAGAALGAAQAALSGGGGGATEDDGGDAPGNGLSSSTFKIVLAVIVIVAVALIAFFALWDFSAAPAEDAPVADSVVAAPAGPEG